MNYKNNKGVTGVDLSVALIVFVLFVGLVSSIAYNFNMSSKAVNRKAIATDIAINKIETLKNKKGNELNTATTTEYANNDGNITAEGITGPYEIITEIKDYKETNYYNNLSQSEKENIQANVIAIVKVTVKYNVGKRSESIDISTAIAKGD